MNKDHDSSSAFGSTLDDHTGLMAAIWGPGINVAIFMALYSYRRYPPIIHALAGIFACIYTLATTIPILFTTGIVSSTNTIAINESGFILYIHYLGGIACLSMILISTILGVMTRIFNLC